VANNEIGVTKKAGKSMIQQQCGCGGAMRGASSDEAQPWLHSKPMDATIGRVIASHCRGGCHGRRFRIKYTKL